MSRRVKRCRLFDNLFTSVAGCRFKDTWRKLERDIGKFFTLMRTWPINQKFVPSDYIVMF